MRFNKKNKLLEKRRLRIRKLVKGTGERPRLVVSFTNKHIYAQCIDDESGHTKAAISTLSKAFKDSSLRSNFEGSAALGKMMGEAARKVGINQVVFDRAGKRYHGCVKAFADAVREVGIQF